MPTTAAQSQKALTAHFSSEQLPPFDSADPTRLGRIDFSRIKYDRTVQSFWSPKPGRGQAKSACALENNLWPGYLATLTFPPACALTTDLAIPFTGSWWTKWDSGVKPSYMRGLIYWTGPALTHIRSMAGRNHEETKEPHLHTTYYGNYSTVDPVSGSRCANVEH